MTQLSTEQIVDYIDGSLSPKEMARVEEYLKDHAEEAEMIKEMRFAMSAALEWHESEPMRVSENFWPKVRDNMGPAPKRGLVSSLRKSLGSLFGTSQVARFSMGAAFAAIVLAMGAFLFAPQNATPPVQASISQSDMMFIQQSVQKHQAYVQSQPAPGDVSSIESGADDDNEPQIP